MKIIAHRGASGLAPENTLLSLATAMVSGADLVEFDVQLTLDGQIVLFHDRSFIDINGNKSGIANHTLEDLYRIDVGTWKNEKFRNIRIPTLNDAMELLDGFSCVVEIKPQYTELEKGRVLELETLNILDDSQGIGMGYISVRDEVTYDWFRNQTQRYRIGLMQKQRSAEELFEILERNAVNIIQTRAAQFSEEDYLKLENYSVETYVYWADKPDEWDYLLQQPIDGILTNFPSLLKGYLTLHKNEF